MLNGAGSRRWRITGWSVTLCGALLAATTCEKDPTTEPEPIRTPTVIVVTPSSATLDLPGGSVQLTAVVQDQNGEEIAEAVVEWSSADSAVAAVTDSGFVMARRLGETDITARYEGLDTLVPVVVTGDLQRLALVAFYDATDGPNWTNNANWLSDKALSEWWGLDLDPLGRVTKIGLYENGLRGRIPPEIGDLGDLSHVYLEGNELHGPLPPEIGRALGLSFLTLDGNPLEGLLPRSMTRLRPVYFSYKDTDLCAPRSAAFTRWLEGIETALQHCTATKHDRLVLIQLYNSLGGPGWTRRDGWLSDLPLSRWAGVTVDSDGRVARLDLANNGLSGNLPDPLGYLGAIKGLDLRDNSALGGTLQEWITELGPDSLWFGDSGLCVPPDEGFGDWLDKIQHWSGDTCTGADSILVSIPVAYLVQTVQNRNAEVPLIAGRDALLRVFPVADATNYHDSEVRTTFYVDGEAVHAVTMTVGGRRGIGVEVDESRMEKSPSALIPGKVLVAGVEMVVEFDPGGELPLKAGSQRRVPESGTLELDVRQMPAMELTIVPVKISGEADSSTVVAAKKLTLDSPQLKEFRTMIPIGEVDFAVREAITVSRSAWLSNGLGIVEMLRKADGATGYYMGISSSRGGAAELGGWVSRSELDGTVIAHEIGHNLSLLHAPCGSPAGHIDPEYPYPGGRTGVWGYDSELQELRDPLYPDLMSYCEPPWTSDYGFSLAFEHRLEKETAAASQLAMEDRRVPTLLLWGLAGRAGVILEPAVVVNALPSLPDAGGPYRITGLGEDGGTLFALDFTPTIEAESGEGHFVFTLPVETQWAGSLASITVSGPGGSDTLDALTRRPLAIVTDDMTGRLRGLLRNADAVTKVAADEDVTLSYGLPDPVSLRERKKPEDGRKTRETRR